MATMMRSLVFIDKGLVHIPLPVTWSSKLMGFVTQRRMGKQMIHFQVSQELLDEVVFPMVHDDMP